MQKQQLETELSTALADKQQLTDQLHLLKTKARQVGMRVMHEHKRKVARIMYSQSLCAERLFKFTCDRIFKSLPPSHTHTHTHKIFKLEVAFQEQRLLAEMSASVTKAPAVTLTASLRFVSHVCAHIHSPIQQVHRHTIHIRSTNT